MQSLFEDSRQALQPIYTLREINKITVLLLQYITHKSQASILTDKNNIFLSEKQSETFYSLLDRLKNSEPLAYLLGEITFSDVTLKVNPHTLIPRPETEELVEWVSTDLENRPDINILDIGTGSGCIAVSLAKRISNSKVWAFDIAAGALQTAKENAEKNNVEIRLEEIDILKTGHYPQQFDVIVSNPPYVCESEKKEMENNVLLYEPHIALFVPDNDPLLFYKAIALFAQKHLRQNGSLYLEINRAFGKETCEMLCQTGFSNIELRKDLNGNDRMIKAKI